MRIGLLISDVAAVLLGLFGLAALLSFSAYINWTGAYHLGRLHLFIVLAVMLAGMTLLFLVPQLHQRILRKTFPWPVRMVFVPLCIGWIVISLSYLRQVGGLDTDIRDFVQANDGWVALAVGVLFAVTIFPFGLAYADLRAEHRMRKAERRRAKHAQALATEAIPASDVPVAGARQPHQTAPRAGKTGPISHAINAVTLLVLAAGAYAWFFGKTTQTPLVDRFLDQYILSVIALVTLAIWILVAANWPRVVAAAQRRNGQSATKTVFGIALGVPLIVSLFYIIIGYSLFPFAWNVATENDVESRTYLVIDVRRTRKMKGCFTVALQDDGPETSLMCGLGRDFGLSLQPGDRLTVTGELSAYGHTFDDVRVVRQ